MNAVRDLGSRRAGLEQARSKVRGFDQNWADIEKDQGRLRQNMESVDKGSQLYAQYMQKMTAQEAKLDDLGPKIEAARGDVARLEKELGDFMASLNVE